MKRNYLFLLSMLWIWGCVKKDSFTYPGRGNQSGGNVITTPTPLAISPTNIYLGSALLMSDMALPHAEKWQTVRNYGVGLHVHPIGWRDPLTGQFGIDANTIGPLISANLNNKTFTYEFDIVDPRAGRINMQEVKMIESYGLTCTRVLCNVDVAELDANPNLPQALRDSVVIPFNDSAIAVDIIISPVSPTALAELPDGQRHIDKLVADARWVNLLFDQANAQGVALDIPTTLYAAHKDDLIIPILQQAKASGHEVTWVANFDGAISNIATLGSLIDDISARDLAPQRWVFENFNPTSNFTPVLEKNFDGSASEHAAGAALYVCRRTTVPEPDDIMYPNEAKYYNIIGAQSGKCIDINNLSTAEGAQAWIWSYIGGLNQQYIFVPADQDGYYKIVSLNSSKCLAIDPTQPVNGSNLIQLTDNGGDHLQWKLTNVNYGYCKIVNKLSGKCIDVQGYATIDSGNIWTNDYLGSDNQKWFYNVLGDY